MEENGKFLHGTLEVTIFRATMYKSSVPFKVIVYLEFMIMNLEFFLKKCFFDVFSDFWLCFCSVYLQVEGLHM